MVKVEHGADGRVAWARVVDPDIEVACEVACPFCGQVTVLPPPESGEPVIAGCSHLEREDFVTPEPEGFSVWFRRT